MTKFAERLRSRWFRWFLGCWLLVAAVAVLPAVATPVLAQGDDKKDAPEDAPAPDMFTHIIKSAGVFFGPMLLLISIGLVTLIVLLAMDLRMGGSIPPHFVDEFADVVNKR